MALIPRMGIRQRQRLGLTQEIKSSLHYLALSGLRLEQSLRDVVANNPFITVSSTHSIHEKQDWIASLTVPGPNTLGAALRALACDLFWRAEDRAMANILIDEVSESGILTRPVDQIERPPGVSLDVLYRIQEAFLEEGGFLANNLRQSFIAQATMKVRKGDFSADTLASFKDICENFDAVRAGKVNLAPEVMDLLKALNPHPVDQLDLDAAVTLPPDLIVERKIDGWSVRLNPLTHQAYDIDGDMLLGLGAKALRRPEIVEPLREAKATVRALEARAKMLLKLMLFLCAHQNTALKRDRSKMQPLTQEQVAAALDVHPSTVSRAVAGKSVQTPQGVWALKDFFTTTIDPKTQFSGAQLRSWLAKSIAKEDPQSPKSDAQLAFELAVCGHEVARRTITKYRLLIGVPGASVRRRFYVNRPVINQRKEVP